MYRSLSLARCGNPRAQEELVANLRPRISKMAAYYAKNTGEDADDLLQEAWLGLLNSLPEVDLTIGDPEQYLIQRARWRLLDAVKRAKIRRCASLDESYLEQPARENTEDAVVDASVEQFTERLKAPQQQILRYLLGGLTWREAGERLGCTSANVAYHVRQIKQQYEQWCAEA